LTQLLLQLLGNPRELLPPEKLALMQAKVAPALELFPYEQLEPVLRWVMSPESDEPKWCWRQIVAGADNPMAMFASKVEKLVGKYDAFNRKHKQAGDSQPRKKRAKAQSNQEPNPLWGKVQSIA
jgi:hypothetical protein